MMKQKPAPLTQVQKQRKPFDSKKAIKWTLISVSILVIGTWILKGVLGWGIILAYIIGSGWKCELEVKQYPTERIQQEIVATNAFLTSQLALVQLEQHSFRANCKDRSEIGTSLAPAKAAYSYETHQSQPEFFAIVKTALIAAGWEHNAKAGGQAGQTTLMFFKKKIGTDYFGLNFYWDQVISERGYWCKEQPDKKPDDSVHIVCVNIEHLGSD